MCALAAWLNCLRPAHGPSSSSAPPPQPAELAALADGLTAYHAAKKKIPALDPGSFAVAVGAGGLGHIGIQCLKAMTSASGHRGGHQ